MSYMKTTVKIIASLSAVLALASCQQFHIDTQMTEEKAAANIRLDCDALDSYTFPAQNPGTMSFNVSSTTPWTITRSSGAEWCNVTPSSSSSSSLISDVVISVEPNTGEEDRSCTLTVKGDNINDPIIITVNQSRDSKLFITPFTENYSAQGGSLSFRILANVPWSVQSDASWLSFSPENGQPDPDGNSITITATAAPSQLLERTATITVYAGDEEESFDVTQTGILVVTELSDPFDGAGGSQDFKILTDLPWTVTCDKNWLSFSKESGTGNGSSETITAIATNNEGAVRTAIVTVTAGGASRDFEVTQKGISFEIVTPESTELPRLGGEMLLEVNSTVSWEPETDVEGWTVEKVDASHFKVITTFNNIFKPKTGNVAIVSGANRAELELTQPINFKFSGDYEIQEDGSVKINCGAKTQVSTIDNFRYAQLQLNFGDKNFGDKGELWVTVKAGGCNIYNQLSLGGNLRIRTDGNLPVSGTSTYANEKYSITKDELNAMTSYGFSVEPNAANPANQIITFTYNGTVKAQQDCLSVFADDPTAAGAYWFGFYNSTSDGTWYIVKSCDITVIEG